MRVEIPRPHPGQAQVIDESKRFNVLCCGRRFGKTELGKERLIVPALQSDPVAWFAPSYKMLSDAWRDVRTILMPVTERANVQEHRLELIGGGSVDMCRLDTPDVARGRKYKRVVVDEAALVKECSRKFISTERASTFRCQRV